jgi:Fe-S-cluster-containing dehydrogenase component
MGYLSNRPRYMGVMEKCTYCLYRTRTGRYPACAEACPSGARKFGDMSDPDSEIRKIVDNERIYVLKRVWTKISTDGKLDPVKHLEMMNQMIKFMADKNVKPGSLVEGK